MAAVAIEGILAHFLVFWRRHVSLGVRVDELRGPRLQLTSLLLLHPVANRQFLLLLDSVWILSTGVAALVEPALVFYLLSELVFLVYAD